MHPTTRSVSLSRFRLLGVEINVHFSWLILALLIAWSLASGAFPQLYAGLPGSTYLAMAVVAVVGLAVSIVLHELAHALVGRAFGISIRRITLFLFGGVAEMENDPKAPRAELLMALAGPAVSVLLGLAFALVASILSTQGAAAEAVGVFGYLATLNILLAVFNLAPAYPLDGGRVLRALIWMITGKPDRATRIAARSGQVFAVVLMMAGLAFALTGGLTGGLWWILIGLFLYAAAAGALRDLTARRLLRGHRIRELMTRRLETAPADMTLDAFVNYRLYASHHGLYPVVEMDRLVGVLEPTDILKTPRETWARTTLGEICGPLDETSTATPDEDVFAVLERMRGQGRTRMLVLERGALAGMVTMADLMERLALAMAFEPATPPDEAAPDAPSPRASPVVGP